MKMSPDELIYKNKSMGNVSKFAFMKRYADKN